MNRSKPCLSKSSYFPYMEHAYFLKKNGKLLKINNYPKFNVFTVWLLFVSAVHVILGQPHFTPKHQRT